MMHDPTVVRLDSEVQVSEELRMGFITCRSAEKDAVLELIRHDCAHIMARAVQEIWPDVKVTIGPVVNNGWYYDFDREEPFTPEDLAAMVEHYAAER